jgi:pimeloyl-ACP methyl ester carboxylesterase
VGTATEWILIAPRLGGPIVIPDRPGFGLSYGIDYRAVDFRAAAAAWLLELTDGLGVDKVNLVGSSMGGFYTMAFATAHPGRVGSLVLTGAPAGLFHSFPLFLRLWANPVMGPLISRLKIRDAEMLRKRVFSGLVAHPEHIPRDVLEVALAGGALPGTPATTGAMLHAVTTLRGLRPELRMTDDVAHLDGPTLFVWGDQDQIAPTAVAEDLVKRMSEGELIVIEDAGHLPHLDQPDAVAGIINRLLANPNDR